MRYEKGRKDASRQKIMEVASERFRRDGIAATGLAAIMSDAGMTNGAFYPHFQSKADLVRETVAAATSATRFGNFIAEEGLETALDAYLSTQSNRLNQVMKVLTVIATVFMVLTVLTGMYGMNVQLPHFPGGPHVQFWWVIGIMAVLSAGMLWIFRRVNWL